MSGLHLTRHKIDRFRDVKQVEEGGCAMYGTIVISTVDDGFIHSGNI